MVMSAWCARVSVVLLLVASGSLAAEELKFPHRSHFKQVPVMELEQLYRQLDSSVVVDVRSRYEYEVLHIKGAMHIPLHKDKLPKAVLLRDNIVRSPSGKADYRWAKQQAEQG
mgnify:CR=1 FL=1